MYGIDYQDTFSPVTKLTSVLILIYLTVTYHLSLSLLDVKNSFLNGVLDEEVYMEQPHEFVARRKLGKMYRFKKSFYKLKQSLRAWFGRFASVRVFGLSHSQKDHYVFRRQH